MLRARLPPTPPRVSVSCPFLALHLAVRAIHRHTVEHFIPDRVRSTLERVYGVSKVDEKINSKKKHEKNEEENRQHFMAILQLRTMCTQPYTVLASATLASARMVRCMRTGQLATIE